MIVIPDSWVGHHLAGRDPGDINDWVDRWHGGSSTMELSTFLGMTAEEYGNWVLAPEALDHILAIRRLIEAARAAITSRAIP